MKLLDALLIILAGVIVWVCMTVMASAADNEAGLPTLRDGVMGRKIKPGDTIPAGKIVIEQDNLMLSGKPYDSQTAVIIAQGGAKKFMPTSSELIGDGSVIRFTFTDVPELGPCVIRFTGHKPRRLSDVRTLRVVIE